MARARARRATAGLPPHEGFEANGRLGDVHVALAEVEDGEDEEEGGSDEGDWEQGTREKESARGGEGKTKTEGKRRHTVLHGDFGRKPASSDDGSGGAEAVAKDGAEGDNVEVLREERRRRGQDEEDETRRGDEARREDGSLSTSTLLDEHKSDSREYMELT